MGHHRTQSCSEAHRLLGNSDLLGQKGKSGFGEGEKRGGKNESLRVNFNFVALQEKEKIG